MANRMLDDEAKVDDEKEWGGGGRAAAAAAARRRENGDEKGKSAQSPNERQDGVMMEVKIGEGEGRAKILCRSDLPTPESCEPALHREVQTKRSIIDNRQ